jgi:hypothetical protein
VWAAWPTVESERTAVKADLGRTMKERIGAIRSARKRPCLCCHAIPRRPARDARIARAAAMVPHATFEQ